MADEHVCLPNPGANGFAAAKMQRGFFNQGPLRGSFWRKMAEKWFLSHTRHTIDYQAGANYPDYRPAFHALPICLRCDSNEGKLADLEAQIARLTDAFLMPPTGVTCPLIWGRHVPGLDGRAFTPLLCV